jgi:alkaline phosphatase D
VLWTRLALDPLAGGAMPPDDVEVTWEMSRDEGFAEIEHEGLEIATAAYAHSVHAIASPDARRLVLPLPRRRVHEPRRRHPHRTRAGHTVDSLRFASASCQNYQAGFYVAHRTSRRRSRTSACSSGTTSTRAARPSRRRRERAHARDARDQTLDEYRNRYGLYKSDPDLQAAHAVCPWFVTWDDHEVENNYAGLTPQDVADQPTFASGGSWRTRRGGSTSPSRSRHPASRATT